ncbi:hypothetical protein GCM10009092_12850 [Bowmanella denitrificans]|uniref:Multidrug resistance protein MdtA-like alpha-helical hairpin domain-containing protein n=1 Tax=Bowmanella denitrificans TaxID=366582 RepID=A0ABN0WXU5_9ALTE
MFSKTSLAMACLLTWVTGCEPYDEVLEVPPAPPPEPLTTVAVKLENPLTRAFFSRIQGQNSIDAALFTPGRIAQVLVKEGELVKQGQLLAKLYSPSLDSRIDAMQAELNSANADLNLARQQLARQKSLRISALNSQQAVDDAQRNVHVAEQKVGQAQALLHEAVNQGKESLLLAPADSIVTKLYHRSGDFVDAGTPIIRLDSSHHQKAVFALPERDALRIQPGQDMSLYLPTLSRTLSGRVAERSAPQPGAPGLFDVSLSLEDADPSLVGLTVRLDLQRNQAILYQVDIAALRFAPAPAGPRAFVITEPGQSMAVEIHDLADSYAVVSSASALTDKLLITPQDKLATNLSQLRLDN